MAQDLELRTIVSLVDNFSKQVMGPITGVGQLANKFTGLMNIMPNVAGAIGGALMIPKIMGFIKAGAEYADTIEHMARRTGLAVDEAQRLDFIAKASGTSLENLSRVFVAMAKETTDGGKSFEKYGISIHNANGNLKSSSQLFTDTVTKLASMQNSTERMAAANAIFGKRSIEVNAIIAEGVEGIAELNDKFDEYGLALDEKMIAKLHQAKVASLVADTAFKDLSAEFSATFTPAIIAAEQALATLFRTLGGRNNMNAVDPKDEVQYREDQIAFHKEELAELDEKIKRGEQLSQLEKETYAIHVKEIALNEKGLKSLNTTDGGKPNQEQLKNAERLHREFLSLSHAGRLQLLNEEEQEAKDSIGNAENKAQKIAEIERIYNAKRVQENKNFNQKAEEERAKLDKKIVEGDQRIAQIMGEIDTEETQSQEAKDKAAAGFIQDGLRLSHEGRQQEIEDQRKQAKDAVKGSKDEAAALLAIDKVFNDKKEKEDKDYTDQKAANDRAQIELEYTKRQAVAQTASSVVGSLGAAAQAFGANAVVVRRLAQFQAVLDTYAAANAAFKNTMEIPVVGPYLAYPAAAAAILYGLANVKMIESQKFQYGTMSAPGGLAMVSEYGRPELLNLPPGTRVHSNTETNRILERNRSETYHFHFYGRQGGLPKTIIAESKRGGEMRRASRMILKTAGVKR